MEYIEKIFDGGNENIDGNRYVRCTFTGGVNLIYSGGPMPDFAEGTKMEDAGFSFAGPAENTVAYLRALLTSPMRAPIRLPGRGHPRRAIAALRTKAGAAKAH